MAAHSRKAGRETIPRAIELGLEHYQAGRLTEAERFYRQVLELDPNNADALHLLGVIARQVGKSEIAIELIERAIRFQRANPYFLNSFGNALREAGRLQEAKRSYRRAVALKPDYAEAHNNLGNVLQELGRPDEAERGYRRALLLNPDYAEAHYNLANALLDVGRLQEAEHGYRQALALNPHFAYAHYNLANVLRDLGRAEEAEQSYRQALALKPDFAEAHNNLGAALQDLGWPQEAEHSYRQALALKPDFAMAHRNLGNALKGLGRLDEAESSCRQALALKPDFAEAHSNLIFILDLQERCDIREQQQERRRWYAAHGRVFANSIRPHENSSEPERCLRIGYVSADFRRHSAYYAFGPIIALHDRAAFEVVCYSGVKREDDLTARLRQAAHLWRSTLGVSDEALAEQIRRDRIDILVDLSGHTADNRLLAFARKPAPIQVTAWGYANGTGLETMNYFFADPVALPKEERAYFAEEVIDLPCILCYEAPEYMPQGSPLPALDGKPFTFGCVNRIEKVSDKVLELWGQILAAAPDARLLMKDGRLGDRGAQEYLLGRLANYGIRAERVVLLGKSAHAEHLKIYHEVDLALDPCPQGGGISTAEALWMGVPLVTLSGLTIPSRVSASILAALDLREWIAHSAEEYVRIALAMARDLPRLARVREELRPRLARSLFGDVQGYTRAVEAVYRSLWRRWCERSSAE